MKVARVGVQKLICIGLVVVNFQFWLAIEDAYAQELEELPTYRRVFVPAADPSDWPVGDQRYLPISQERFSQLLAGYRRTHEENWPVPPSIGHAKYHCELLPNRTLKGSAHWQIELPGDRPRLLSLAEFGLPLYSATWQSESERPALVGYWQFEDASSEPALWVEASDTLRLEWQLTPRSSEAESADFSFSVPVAIPQFFSIELPVVARVEMANARLVKKELVSEARQTWHFQLPAISSHQLRVVWPSVAGKPQPRPLVSQTTAYEVEPSGLTFGTELRVDARDSTVRQLTATFPNGIRIAEVTIDQQAAEWHVEPASDEQLLVVSRPFSNQPQVLDVRAQGDYHAEGRWNLPILRFEEVNWTEGSMSLFVSPEIELRSLTPQSASLQHVVGIVPSSQGGEVHRLQQWNEQASLEIVVGSREPQLEEQRLASFEIDRNVSKARIESLVVGRRGVVFQLEASIAPGWALDSVTANPASALREWTFDRSSMSNHVRILLDRPIVAGSTLPLSFVMHKLGEEKVLPATLEQLNLLQFVGVARRQYLLHLWSREAQEVRVPRRLEELRMDVEHLPRELQLPNSTTRQGSLLDVSHLPSSERIAFRRQPQEFEAEFQINVEALPETLMHQYQVECRVQSGAISELLLAADEPLPSNLEWQIAGQQGSVVQERVEVNAGSVGTDGLHRYRLRLPSPQAQDFLLQSQYSQPKRQIEACNLLRVTDDLRWSGTVLVRGELNSLRVHDRGRTPRQLSAPLLESDSTPVLGVYTWNPEEERRARTTGKLRITRLAEPTAPAIVACLASYETTQATDGTALHTASYYLENIGTSEVVLSLPPTAVLHQAWIDQQQYQPEEVALSPGVYQFRFRPEERFPLLVLNYSTEAKPLKRTQRLKPATPHCSFPISRSQWTLLAPEQYEIDKSRSNYSSVRYHWWKRLFGPLARSRGETVFDPLETSDWHELWSVPLAGQQAKTLAQRMVDRLREELTRAGAEPFGALIEELAAECSAESLLHIDRTALLAEGIQGATLAQSLVLSSATDRGRSNRPGPLSNYHLAFVVSPGSILLTTPGRVSHWYDQLRVTETEGLLLAATEDLVSQIEFEERQSHSQLMTVLEWSKAAPADEAIWQQPSGFMTNLGTSSRTVEFVEESPTLVLRKAYFVRALWYEVALLTVVVGVWKLAHFPNLMVLLGVFAGAACLVVPAHLLTIFQAIFLGLIAAAIVRIVIKTAEISEGSAKVTANLSRHTLMVFCVAGVASVQSKSLHAQQKENVDVEVPAVLVPIDETGKRQGEEVYVPEDLLRRLQSSDAANHRDGSSVAILSASYHGSLPVRLDQALAVSERLELEPWVLRWKVESFVPDCRVRLPLIRSEANWQEGAHHLDGRPVTLDWEPDGNGCSVELPDTGVHWLEVAVRPRMLRKGGHAVMQLHVVRVPESKLEVSTAMQSTEVEVLGSGRLEWERSRGLLSASLAPLGLIELRCHLPGMATESAPMSRVQPMTWLKIGASSTRVDLQLHISGMKPSSRIIELDVSSQLKLAALPANSFVERVLPSSASSPNQLRLLLREGLPEDFVVQVPFELRRQVSVGRYFYPKIAVRGAPSATGLFAVSVASGLSFDEQYSAGFRSLQPDEFTQVWEDASETPLFAYAIAQETSDWSLRVWPDPRSLKAREDLRVDCYANALEVEYEAEFAELRGDWLIQQLHVPARMSIDSVTVVHQDAELAIPVRWSRSQDLRLLTVFSETPLRRNDQLRLKGQVPAELGAEVELPAVHLLRQGPTQLRLQVFSDERVQVSWVSDELVSTASNGKSIPRLNDGYKLGEYQWTINDSLRTPLIRLDRNRQLITADTITTLMQGDAGWKVTLSSQVQVREGDVHRLRVNAPLSFGPPFAIEPRSVGIVEAENEVSGRKEIAIRLSNSLKKNEARSIQLTGNLKLSPEQKVVVPDLRFLGTARQDRFVLLPRLVDGRPIIWQTTGLRRELVPDQLSDLIAKGQPSFGFRVLRPEFKAMESSYRGILRSAKLRHAIVDGFVDETRLLTATAELILQPGRSTACALRLPPQAELLQLVLNDIPVRREVTEDGNWRVVLGPPWMPQRILVSYRCPVERTDRQLRFTAPEVLLGDKPLPFPDTWWNVQVPQHWQLDELVHARLGNSAEMQRASYQAVQNTLRDGLSESLELPSEEGMAWLGFWDRRLRKADRNRAASTQEQAHADMNLETESIRQAIVEHYDQASRNGVAILGELQQPPTIPPQPIGFLRKQAYVFLSQDVGHCEALFYSSSGGSFGSQFRALALLAAAGLLVSRLRRVPHWHQRLCEWPHGLAFAGGVLWWLLLRPSALGMLVMLVTSVSYALQSWRSYRGGVSDEPDTQLAMPAN